MQRWMDGRLMHREMMDRDDGYRMLAIETDGQMKGVETDGEMMDGEMMDIEMDEMMLDGEMMDIDMIDGEM